MDDMPFGLARNTYASLNAQDLEELGKEAATMFLCDGMSLNDAVIKLAQRHPSISTHQVKRVVEFANTESFQRLFEKQAGDKNVEFEIADPGVVLRNLELGASGGVSTPTPSEYSSTPVKLAHSEVEADLQLARLFGVELTSSHAEKVSMEKRAYVEPTAADRVLPAPVLVNPVDRVLEKKSASAMALLGKGAKTLKTQAMNIPGYQAINSQLKTAQMPLMAGPAPEANGVEPQQQHHEQMLDLTRQIEVEKKKQELAKIQQQTMQAMSGGAPGAAGGEMGATATGEPSVPPPPEYEQAMAGAPSGGMQGGPAAPAQGPVPEKIGAPYDTSYGVEPQYGMGPMMGQGQSYAELAQEAEEMGLSPEEAQEYIMEGMYGSSKTGSRLTKQAMDYVKTSGPKAGLVLDDLRRATSLERIKEATTRPSPYPDHNPHRELMEARVTLLKLAEEADHAKDRNAHLTKEAEAEWTHAVMQHVLGGGSFGEVAHAIAHVDDSEDAIKLATQSLLPHFEHHQIDPATMQAQLIKYDMEKTANRRQVNPANPIVQSFATFLKLASGQEVLDDSARTLKEKLAEVNQALSEALVHAAAI